MSLPLIEGVGDGVVVLLGILVALVVVIFAWWSTNVAETRVVGVIYLSTSHFNRLLRHLGQTPTTDATTGQSRTFFVPPAEHGNDSVNALSLAQSLPVTVSNPVRDASPAAVVVKQGDPSSVPAESSAGESIDASSVRGTEPRPRQGRSVPESGDVYTDAQSSRVHSRSEPCSDGGRLRSTPDGVVLEGCMHFDDSGNDMLWTEMYSDDSGDDREDNASQPMDYHSGASAPTTNTQHEHAHTDSTNLPISLSSSLAHTSSGNVLENHRGENDNDNRTVTAGEINSVDSLETVQSDDIRQTARPCQTCTVDAAVSSRCEHTNAASQTCNREPHQSDTGVAVPPASSSDGNRLSPTIDNIPEESVVRDSEGRSDPGSTIVTANILRARNVQAGYVTVRIKYLDDQQRDVQTRLEDTVADFKRQHFAAELSTNCTVRFVHNGQELRGETATLRSFNVVDNSVIHCWLSRPILPTASPSPVVPAASTQLDFGCLVVPLFAMLLLLVWYCRFSYHVYFSAVSTFCLVAMTLVFAVCLFVSMQFVDDTFDDVTI